MKKIDLRWFGECSPKHRRYSLMFAEHSVTIADCSLRWSVIHRRYICYALVKHQRNFGDASPRPGERVVVVCGHPRGEGERRREGGGGGIDLYKFLSWFMSVIFLYYFTCMFLSRFVRAFLLSFTLCTVY